MIDLEDSQGNSKAASIMEAGEERLNVPRSSLLKQVNEKFFRNTLFIESSHDLYKEGKAMKVSFSQNMKGK